MTTATSQRVHTAIARIFPEQRLFLRSATTTRFIRLSPETQFIAAAGSALVLGWTLVASALLVMDSLGAGDLRDQAAREQALYEDRLNQLAAERDTRAAEAVAAQDRFAIALAEVSQMQTRLLNSEERRRELETGIDVMQSTLQTVMQERDTARDESETLLARLDATESADVDSTRVAEMEKTVDFLSAALGGLAEERDEMRETTQTAQTMLDDMLLDARLEEERHARIFTQIEDAVAASMEPLDDMFGATGLPTDSILEQVRRSYSGQGGPSLPVSISTSGSEEIDPLAVRANEVLEQLDTLNLYRIAAEKVPLSMPVKGAYRNTSGFGPRWGRMHKGQDWAGATGSPIYATADGVITFAGRQSGYGNLIKIKHDFGIETRYAHLNKIRVKVGERVSRGDRIGDMGNTGRSTGTHLHYEVRVGSKAVNPMTYIKAARDVF